MKKYSSLLLTIVLITLGGSVFSREYIGDVKKTKSTKAVNAAGCTAGAGYQFLDVNNVRARINTGGDMWWDLGGGVGAQYYIPANTTKTSLYAGALWIGGTDVNDQLKLAAHRYRQVGIDYWPGPLTTDQTASISPDVCNEYDKFFPISREEVDLFLAWFNSTDRTNEFPGYTVPKSIEEWPAHGDQTLKQSRFLAPFKDVDGDENYQPDNGDYPYYDIPNELCHTNTPTMESLNGYINGGLLADQVLKGDKTFWWVFNDKGNSHTETGGAAIGLEIRAQAFGFTTNDEINNMTFYSYEIINRSTFTLYQTYFSPWNDIDLGFADDDYIGCDVVRGMGYGYNGKSVDGTGQAWAYGAQPPATGIDFFQGPYMDPDGYDNPSFRGTGVSGPTFPNDQYPNECSIVNLSGTVTDMTFKTINGEDSTAQFLVRAEAINGVNFGNGIVDDERFGMARFDYHNNGGAPYWTDPDVAAKYYNLLRGIWNDNTLMLYGGNGHVSTGAVGPACYFMFPGDSDPCNWGTNGTPPNGGFNQGGLYWTEEQAGNQPGDRRIMQSAGPFTLSPGAVNYITFGVPWARAQSGGPWASVELLRVVDDKCQALFDNCFKVLDGPDAPEITIQELDKQLIIYLTNTKTSNNYKEKYAEMDPTIKVGDSLYRFEGYQIYQLKNAAVGVESLDDAALTRLVAQYDIVNGVSKIVNFNQDDAIGYSVPAVEVDGGDNGIDHSFIVSEDQFATGDRALINYKQYYFLVVAYAYNNYKTYDPNDPSALDGQKKPYLAGRRNISVYTGIPHRTLNGTVSNGNYGDRPQITRLQGQGNGGMNLEFTSQSVDNVLTKGPISGNIKLGDPEYPIVYNPTYEIGYGPLDIKVVDPLRVKKGNFTVQFFDCEETGNQITKAKWKLIDNTDGTTYYSDTTIQVGYEQLILDLGLSVKIFQVASAGTDNSYNNGFVEGNLVIGNLVDQWVTGIPDGTLPAGDDNWIRSGTYKGENALNNDWNMGAAVADPWDPSEFYEKILSGTWSPYGLTATNTEIPGIGPCFNKTISLIDYISLDRIGSVDLVLTADKAKWTRCPVIEMGNDIALSEGGASRFDLRKAPSIDKYGNRALATDTASDDPDAPNYISATGYGWFPGYAINIETGERLNLMFGEDSWLVGENGRDMLWNPSSTIFSSPNGAPVFGGKHYVYIMRHQDSIFKLNKTVYFPAYDGGKMLGQQLNANSGSGTIPRQVREIVYSSADWVWLPVAVAGKQWLGTDMRYRMRVGKPYQRHYSTAMANGSTDTINQNFPLYNFTTEGIETVDRDITKVQSDLDLINIVPNPYYAWNEYETNALTNLVKFTNLPRKCTVTIYAINGTLLKQFTKDSDVTYIEWNLTNFAGVPISGGMYLIHVKSDDGERILKWFGAMRPVDLNTF
ncbi:MAG TPA: T9SS C-terminal target domain-containing protein [Bacteroidales bacterium]|nr:MAG: hypothetical protein A2X11_03520 [Bacteroidetes bacterium GWE2_42_24]OFY32706.1 MAG: hypothetical protein A2X09_06600 [Bacteroidetes bacterium GWF2_43_11]HBZ65232.1 T9SS C-terminal target domain-containing protein [Bacteroidales bacterium]